MFGCNQRANSSRNEEISFESRRESAVELRDKFGARRAALRRAVRLGEAARIFQQFEENLQRSKRATSRSTPTIREEKRRSDREISTIEVLCAISETAEKISFSRSNRKLFFTSLWAKIVSKLSRRFPTSSFAAFASARIIRSWSRLKTNRKTFDEQFNVDLPFDQ